MRELRHKRGMSCREVAEAVGVSESKISRMETGDRGLYADDVAAILGFLQAPLKQRQELVALVRDGQARNWHAIHGKLPDNWKEVITFESQAKALYNYQSLVIPGLAQTPEYARAVLSGCNDLDNRELDTLVASRMARQVVLTRAAIHLLVDEMALRRRFGDPGMMRGQLQHLRTVIARPNVVFQIVPHDVPAHPGLDGPFLILDFADQPSLVYVESRRTSTFLEESEHIDAARVAWSKIHALALSPDDSIRLLATIESELA